MEIAKPTEGDKEYFWSIVPDGPDVTTKPMFGNLACFVNGNMFMGLFGSDVGLKLAPADLEELAGVEGVGPFGPAERPMGAYLSLPSEWRERPHETEEWVARALSYVATLPPKKPKKKKKEKD